MVTGLDFVDFRKAFDVINHELLLKKLPIYGANDLSLKWFGSYLTGRKQVVSSCYKECLKDQSWDPFSFYCL